jgi:hypothetical protein
MSFLLHPFRDGKLQLEMTRRKEQGQAAVTRIDGATTAMNRSAFTGPTPGLVLNRRAKDRTSLSSSCALIAERRSCRP